MVRSLVGWLPNDVNWKSSELTKESLSDQCDLRNISSSGYKSELVERLEDYHRANSLERRSRGWDSRPACRPIYAQHLKDADNASFQVAWVVDQTVNNGGQLVKELYLTNLTLTEEPPSVWTVTFGNTMRCSHRTPVVN